MVVKFKYNEVEYIKEKNLPENWSEVNIAGFTKLAPFYSQGIEQEATFELYDTSIDDLVVSSLSDNKFSNILDVGVGDGVRLTRIRKKLFAKGRDTLNMFGTELSDSMIAIALEKGIDVKKHDMKNPLPFDKNSMDMIVYLSGDLGYVMDKNHSNGQSMRLNAINSAYNTLKPNGVLFMELLAHDNENQYDETGMAKPGHVLKYSRTTFIDGEKRDDLEGTFYLKQFRFSEMRNLVEASKFNINSANVRYILRSEKNEGGDTSRIGKIIQTYHGFEGFDIIQIHPGADKLKNSPRANYRMIVELRK